MPEKQPSGVRYWTGTGEASSVKGKKTPDAVNAGRAVTGSKVAGSTPKRLSTDGGGTGKRVSAVRYHSGTEDRKTSPSAKRGGGKSAPKGGNTSARPAGVRSHDGLSVPKKVKSI